MTLTRRAMLLATSAAAATASSGPSLGSTPAKVQTGDDGLHIQPFFQQTFLDLRDDLAQASAEGKRLVVFWEQRGCPYCRELHAVNFADPETAAYIKQHYFALQLNLYGSRPVVDFDGKSFEERRLAERWRVNFTPTVQFFPPKPEEAAGKSGRDAEVFRLPGYFKPFHFLATLVYVTEQGDAKEPFQRWMSEYAEKLRKQGKPVKLW